MFNKRTYIGIDPGKDGGMAVINIHTGNVYTAPYNKESYDTILKGERLNDNEVFVIIEDVHAIQGSRAGATFNFGRNVGFIQGLVFANKIQNIAFITPQKWKDFYGLIGSDKQGSIDKAHYLYPSVNLYKTLRSRNMHDGLAEALLIANYGMLKNKSIKWEDNLEL